MFLTLDFYLDSFRILLLLLGPVPWAAWTAAASCCGDEAKRGPLPLLVAFGAGWFLFQMLAGILLGMVGLFSTTGLVLGEFALIGSGIAALSMVRGTAGLDALRSAVRWLFPMVYPESAVLRGLVWVGAITTAAVLLVPTTSFDTLSYHLPSMATWVALGNLTMFDHYYYISLYPFGWELLGSMWFLATGSDSLVYLVNLMVWAYWALSLFALCRAIGATTGKALLSTVIAVTCPIAVLTLTGVYVDVPLAAFFTAALYFAIGYHETRSLRQLALFLVSFALICSVKMSGPVYGVLIGAVLAGLELTRLPDWRSWLPGASRLRADAKYIAALLGVAFVACGYWYLRNLWNVGNPLGFVEVKIGSFVLFPAEGPIEEMVRDPARGSLLNLFDWSSPEDRFVVGREILRYFGLNLPLLLVLALGLPYTLFKGGDAPRKYGIALLFLIPITAYLYAGSPFTGDNGGRGYVITPWMGWQLRYSFPLITVLAASASISAWVLPRMLVRGLLFTGMGYTIVSVLIGTKPIKWFFVDQTLLEGFLGMWQWFAVRQASITVTCFCAALALIGGIRLLGGWPGDAPRATGRRYGRAALGVFVLLSATYFFALAHHAAKQPAYGPVIGYIREHAPAGSVVAYAQSQRGYWFVNDDWSNRVQYVPARNDDPMQWLQELVDADTSIFIIGPTREKMSAKELDWTGSGPVASCFHKVLGKDGIEDPLVFEFDAEKARALLGAR
ncbi:MAG: hypothetical protein GC168_11620 [Candidatus Hydrogenedens sp.]|nr:hypothetical protein [Candidatus Hydrogenedens sp.]